MCKMLRAKIDQIEQKIWTIAEMSNNDAVNISLPNILTLTMEAGPLAAIRSPFNDMNISCVERQPNTYRKQRL